jgi:hypothetical protein
LESPRNACVSSQLNPVPIKFRDLAYQDNFAVNLYVVDGFGNFDPRSGDPNTTVKVALGLPGQTPIWLNTTWTPIANGWQGAIQTTNTAFGALFTSTGMNPIQVTLEVKLTNLQGAVSTVGQFTVNIFNDQIAGTPNPDVLMNSILGSFQLSQGVDTYTITGLGLVTAPLNLLLHPIRKPSSGLNIVAVPINGTLTQDGFSFTLSGQPDSNNYWLDYVITFSNTAGAGAPSFINYAGPPLVNPPLLQNIVVDINYRQWQYGPQGWL